MSEVCQAIPHLGSGSSPPNKFYNNNNFFLTTLEKCRKLCYNLKVKSCIYFCGYGEIGRRKGLKIPRTNTPYRFKSGYPHQKTSNSINVGCSFLLLMPNISKYEVRSANAQIPFDNNKGVVSATPFFINKKKHLAIVTKCFL